MNWASPGRVMVSFRKCRKKAPPWPNTMPCKPAQRTAGKRALLHTHTPLHSPTHIFQFYHKDVRKDGNLTLVRVKYLFIYTFFKQINTMPGTLVAVARGKTKYN